MNITGILSSHKDAELTADTLDSARKYLTDDIHLLVDGAAWHPWGQDIELPVSSKIRGLYHNHNRGPYRNLTYSLMKTLELSPDSDWYCYFEYDVLFASDSFKKILAEEKEDTWCMGFDFRNGLSRFALLEKIFQSKFHISKYLIGCCVFYNGTFLRFLRDLDFFEKFLYCTNGFDRGFFPGYKGYDFGEHLYPTLAHYLGGNVKSFSDWDETNGIWNNKYDKLDKDFSIRFRPELENDMEKYQNSSILHPLKNVEHPVRKHFRNIRNGT